MYKKILIGGVTAAAIVGAGGTALAVSGSTTTPGSPVGSPNSSAGHPAQGKHKGKRALGVALRRVEHGQFVTRKKDGTITHDVIRGTVSSVSPTSITVVAADNTTQTYVVNGSTKVRVRDHGKGAAGKIGDVHAKDHVMVLGTGASTFTATHIVDRPGPR